MKNLWIAITNKNIDFTSQWKKTKKSENWISDPVSFLWCLFSWLMCWEVWMQQIQDWLDDIFWNDATTDCGLGLWISRNYVETLQTINVILHIRTRYILSRHSCSYKNLNEQTGLEGHKPFAEIFKSYKLS